ncbi:MAG: hypothetical protein ACXAD7_06595 [Candidatus Kariarchaeaceae archaeon]
MTTSLLIDWNLFYVWDALPESYAKLGLNKEAPIRSFLTYWAVHNSPMHLFYVFCLFVLSLNGRIVSPIQGIMLLLLAFITLPVITWGLASCIANTLVLLGSDFMQEAIRSTYYIGASAIAWGFIGLSRRKDRFVGTAFVFPFCYKLIFSQVYDFTPDVAHACGYVLGYLVSFFNSGEINVEFK